MSSRNHLTVEASSIGLLWPCFFSYFWSRTRVSAALRTESIKTSFSRSNLPCTTARPSVCCTHTMDDALLGHMCAGFLQAEPPMQSAGPLPLPALSSDVPLLHICSMLLLLLPPQLPAAGCGFAPQERRERNKKSSTAGEWQERISD